MVKNAVLAAFTEAVLACAACWALGLDGGGFLARTFAGKELLQRLMAILLPWLAGIGCFQIGYRLRDLGDIKKNLLSFSWPVLAAFLAAVLSLGRFLMPLKALALPFVPLLTILGLPEVWPWYGVLAVFAPLLLLAGFYVRYGMRRKGLTIVLPYLGMLLIFPVIGLMLSMM